MDKYVAHAAADDDAGSSTSMGIRIKTEMLKAFDAAVKDSYFWNYLEPCCS